MPQTLLPQPETDPSKPSDGSDGVGRRVKADSTSEGRERSRVDVEAARRQSGSRRRPSREAANLDQARGEPTPPMPSAPPSSMPPPPDPQPGEPASPAAPAAEQSEIVPAQSPDKVPARPSSAPVPASSSSKNQQGFNKHVCPFCGTKREAAAGTCPHCGMADSDETRAATIARVGPWFLLQPRNPSAPGMRFSVLRELVRGGQVLAGGVVRGPTTHQLWTYAARVRGLGHLFGICWSCNRRLPNVKPGEDPDDFCLYCGALQEAPANPDQQLEALGTTEVEGVTPSRKAGQVSQVDPAKASAAGIEFREMSASPQATPAAVARRPNTPRPLPPSAKDGGDSLLGTRELATAFNLDRRRTLMGDMARFPWLRFAVGLLVTAFIVAALWIAASVLWEPAMRILGGDDSAPTRQAEGATPSQPNDAGTVMSDPDADRP